MYEFPFRHPSIKAWIVFKETLLGLDSPLADDQEERSRKRMRRKWEKKK